MIDDQVGRQRDRIGGEDRELGHQQEDTRTADEERLVCLLEDLREPAVHRREAARQRLEDHRRQALDPGRQPIEVVHAKVSDVRGGVPGQPGGAVDDPTEQLVRRDEERPEVAVLLALHEAVGQARVAPPEPLGRIGGSVDARHDGVDDALVADATCERDGLADLEPECVGRGSHDGELDRLVGGRGLGPCPVEQLSVLLHASEGAEGREVADLVRVLAGQREAVGDAERDDVEPDRTERRPEGVMDGGVGGADRRRIDPRDHLDACVGDRRRFELTVQAGDRHRARVDRTCGEQACRRGAR